MIEQVDTKTYFKVYQKYINSLGVSGTDELDLDLDDAIVETLQNKAKEYGVSLDTIIGGYLELSLSKSKGMGQYDVYDSSMKEDLCTKCGKEDELFSDHGDLMCEECCEELEN